jgi:hypothetical protein
VDENNNAAAPDDGGQHAEPGRMAAATESGAVVFSPVPAFYTRPGTVDNIVGHTVARVLDLFGLSNVLDVRDGASRTERQIAHRTAFTLSVIVGLRTVNTVL